MSSIATSVFNATVGWLINKARDTAAEKLKEGDVTDEKIRSLIVREIDLINKKLDGLARKDLLSSISAFKEGIAILFDVFDTANKGVKEPKKNVTEQAAAAAATTVESTEVSLQSSASAQAKAVSLANKLANLPLIDLDESSKELLSDAKERFKEARNQARNAFSNEALDTPDRILAMMIRVMATILEKVDDPVKAITPCRVCLEELHVMPAVKKMFNITLEKGLKSWFGKGDRKEIVVAVCDINHAIFDVTLMVGSNSLIWPLIDVGVDNVHPLRDARVAEFYQRHTQFIGSYPIQWSFGADILKSTRGICSNTEAHFIVGDSVDRNIKVFARDGNFLQALHFEGPTLIYDVAADREDSVYVLCRSRKPSGRLTDQVSIFDKNSTEDRCTFDVGPESLACLTVVEEDTEKESKEVCVLGKWEDSKPNFAVNVYETDGRFSRNLFRFVEEDDCEARGITECNDGRVMVLYQNQVYVFSAGKGDFSHKFSVCHEPNRVKKMKPGAIHWACEHVIVASKCGGSPFATPSRHFDVSIYKEDGHLVQHFPIRSSDKYDFISGITMDKYGRIALALSGKNNAEILVL